MVHDPSEVGIRESDAPMRPIAQDLAGAGAPVRTEEKSRLRTQVRMPPAIQDEAGDIALWIETSAAEHHGKLLADPALVDAERRGKQFGSPASDLLSNRQPGR